MGWPMWYQEQQQPPPGVEFHPVVSVV